MMVDHRETISRTDTSVDIAFALPPLLVNPDSNDGQRARKCICQCAREVGKAKMRPQGVVFSIGGAFHPRASKEENATALRALLDCLVELDLIYLDAYPSTPGLYQAGVVYHLMPSTTPWDTIPTLYNRKFGDCKSLAAARIAEVRRSGKTAKPVFRHITDGWGTMFHILILHENGNWECPSRALGMRTVLEQPSQARATGSRWTSGTGCF